MRPTYFQIGGVLFIILLSAIIGFWLENHKLKKQIQEAPKK
jgi:uncharacterized protein YneF (UPF0154 family)